MAVDKTLLGKLVCPQCKGPLYYAQKQQELICKREGLAYPVRNDVPVMLASEARAMDLSEVEAL